MHDQGEPVAALTITYVKVKVARGQWWGQSAATNRRHLFAFARFLPALVAAAVGKVRRRHVQGWLDQYGTAPAYRRAGRSAVRGFFGWCVQEGRIDKDPTVGVEIAGEPESAPRRFTDGEVARLFAEAKQHRLRDHLCVSLCWEEGLRCCEVSRMLIEDIDLTGRWVDVRGKGHRGRVSRGVPLSDRSHDLLVRYLSEAPARTGPLIRSQLTSLLGVSPARVGQIVTGIVKGAGLKWFPGDGRSAHAGRHTSATQALEAGASSELMCRFYGWESDATLKRYTRSARLDLPEIHRLRAARAAAYSDTSA